MEKEFEALEELENYINNIIFAKDLINQKQQLLTNINTIKNALQELKAIKETESNEALEYVDVLYANAIDLTTENTKYLPEYLKPIRDKIKQALIKSQKDEKIVLGIEDYLNLRIKTEPREDVRKSFIEIRDQLKVIKGMLEND